VKTTHILGEGGLTTRMELETAKTAIDNVEVENVASED
jgi:hypothetical protein